METIHVQLSDERRIIAMFEQFRNQRPRKLIFIEYDKRSTVFRPTDQVGILGFVEETAARTNALVVSKVLKQLTVV